LFFSGAVHERLLRSIEGPVPVRLRNRIAACRAAEKQKTYYLLVRFYTQVTPLGFSGTRKPLKRLMGGSWPFCTGLKPRC